LCTTGAGASCAEIDDRREFLLDGVSTGWISDTRRLLPVSGGFANDLRLGAIMMGVLSLLSKLLGQAQKSAMHRTVITSFV
jgi:hypothetical protein